MEYAVNIERKNELYKRIQNVKKWPQLLNYGLPICALLFSLIFLCISIMSQDAFVIRDVTDSALGEKNILLIWVIVITVDIILVFLWAMWKIAAISIVGRNIMDRKNESLEIVDDVLIYGYQNVVGSDEKDRVEVRIPLGFDFDIGMKFEESIGRITFHGKICQTYYEDYAHKRTRADGVYKDQEFVIYDYFCPSLYDFFWDKPGR